MPWDHQNRNRHQKLRRMAPASLKIMPYLARSWPKRGIQQKLGSQALGPSKSEPPSKAMPDGSGIVENHALFDPFIAKTYN